MLFSDCKEDSHCPNYLYCGENQQCADPLAHCAKPSWYKDGYCDDENNILECGFDGGDCCGNQANFDYCSVCKCLDNAYANMTTTTTNSDWHDNTIPNHRTEEELTATGEPNVMHMVEKVASIADDDEIAQPLQFKNEWISLKN